MSKPLELTIYPPRQPRPIGPEFRSWFRDYLAEGHLMTTKHLTEAELCAEFGSARCDAMIQRATGRCWQPFDYTWPMDPESINNLAQTLLRFAATPHYFEEQA